MVPPLKPAQKRYAPGHRYNSLRRGMINSAKRQGYGQGNIMPQTRHRSHEAFDAYEHEEDVLDATLDLGL